MYYINVQTSCICGSPYLPTSDSWALQAPTQVEATEPIYPLDILVEIIGTEMSCQGCLCKEHKMCGELLKEGVVVGLRKMQLMVEGKSWQQLRQFG
jgi:hypothetical protein